MARFLSDPDGYPLAEQIKNLADEELLDFWEETQHIERFVAEESGDHEEAAFEYERIILQELQHRVSMRSLGKGA